MGLFSKIGDALKKVGKVVGGIATAIVPGFDTLAKTGIMGSDLAAYAGGPQQSAVQQVIASSPTMVSNTLAPSPGVVAPPAGLQPQSPVALALAPRALSGRTVTMPMEYAKALADAARFAGVSPVQGAGSPGNPVTPLSAVRAQLPTSGMAPNIAAALLW